MPASVGENCLAQDGWDSPHLTTVSRLEGINHPVTQTDPQLATPPGRSSAIGLGALLGDTAAYGVATLASPVAAIITVPVLTRQLGPEGFGTVDLLLTIMALSGMAATMGLDVAAARSWFDRGTPPEHQLTVLGTAVRAVALASSVVAAVGVLVILALLVTGLGGSGRQISAALVAFVTLPLITTQMMVREGFRLARRRAWFVAVAVSGAVIGSVAAVLMVVTARLGPSGYFAGLGAGAFAALAVGLAANHALLRTRLDRAGLRVMLNFGLPLLPASGAVWTLLLADRVIVGAFRGVDEVGLYGLGSRIAIPLFLAVQAFEIAWTPFVLRAHRDAPVEEPRMRGRAATFILAGTVSGAVALVAAASPLVQVLGGARFERAAAVVLPLTLAWIAYAASTVGFIAFSMKRRSPAMAKATGVSAVLGVVLATVLVPIFGFVGAAWATALSYFVLAGLALRVGQRISAARFDVVGLVMIGAVALLGLTASTAVNDDGAGSLPRVGVWLAVTLTLSVVALRRKSR